MSKERAQQAPVVNFVLPNNIGGYPMYPPTGGPAAASQVSQVLAPTPDVYLVESLEPMHLLILASKN